LIALEIFRDAAASTTILSAFLSSSFTSYSPPVL
jgi:hypothetical protein